MHGRDGRTMLTFISAASPFNLCMRVWYFPCSGWWRLALTSSYCFDNFQNQMFPKHKSVIIYTICCVVISTIPPCAPPPPLKQAEYDLCWWKREWQKQGLQYMPSPTGKAWLLSVLGVDTSSPSVPQNSHSTSPWTHTVVIRRCK